VVPIKDDDGNVVSQRIDNLIHASASVEDAEREVKLWFKPRDMPPLMRIYPVEVCDTHFYLQGDRLLSRYRPGCICLLAPGDTAWSSDLEALRLIAAGAPAATKLDTVAAKYLINDQRGE
jgi:hypothetical protein